jgi:hypothetical protein
MPGRRADVSLALNGKALTDATQEMARARWRRRDLDSSVTQGVTAMDNGGKTRAVVLGGSMLGYSLPLAVKYMTIVGVLAIL